MPFTFTPLSLPDVVRVSPRLFKDDRGVFAEAYKHSEFADAGITDHFVQDNLSASHYGVLRGLHYQNPPYAQAKLVRCVQGTIWDVAVDIRHGSSTYGQWVGAMLSDDNADMLYVPEGFAHGFLVLSPTATVYYKTSGQYHQPSDAGIAWNDPAVSIQWPDVSTLILSDKDKQLPRLQQADNQFAIAVPA